MWEDEDNNPYGSFQRRDSDGSDEGFRSEILGTASLSISDQPPAFSTAGEESGEQPEQQTQHQRDDDDDDDGDAQDGNRPTEPKKGGYSSRVEQILYERPDLDIYIVHAGKNTEGGGGYITYTIRTGDIEVRRRYSEFASLRQTLVNLHPTLIIPPIPEKHSISDYASKPTKAREDVSIIELRQRMLTTFLNRCRRMKQVREDGVWWRFLDPNASWNEVLHSHPVASIPKNNLKAPPLNPANPSPGHSYLPIPSSSAKLKSAPSTPASPRPSSQPQATLPSVAAHTTPGTQVFARFPPETGSLSENELDPYFVHFEASSKDLETLLQGNMEKANQKCLHHLTKLGDELMELGGRYNAFSLSEQSQTVAAAIEKTGQACDFTYIQTRDMSNALSAHFAEPMRESAQFAGVVRNVLRYRVLKRVQEEMTRDELDRKRSTLECFDRKRSTLEALERSEMEAKRIEQHLNSPSASRPQQGRRSGEVDRGVLSPGGGRGDDDDDASLDSDFAHAAGAAPRRDEQSGTDASRRSNAVSSSGGGGLAGGGNYVTNKLFGRLTHAIHGVVDSDPERARRDQIGKTKESLVQLEQALEVSKKDVRDASAAVLKDLKRFQRDKEDDLCKYALHFAKCHVDWARSCLETWEEAKEEVGKIRV